MTLLAPLAALVGLANAVVRAAASLLVVSIMLVLVLTLGGVELLIPCIFSRRERILPRALLMELKTALPPPLRLASKEGPLPNCSSTASSSDSTFLMLVLSSSSLVLSPRFGSLDVICCFTHYRMYAVIETLGSSFLLLTNNPDVRTIALLTSS